MASSCTVPSSLMLTHAASGVHPHDLSPSLRPFTFKPLSRTFSLYPLILKPTRWVQVSFNRDSKSRSSHAVVAALAIEVEVAETVDEVEEEGGDGSKRVCMLKRIKIDQKI